jgi:photosystem II stability/assembly factor-like uncharacterized protein
MWREPFGAAMVAVAVSWLISVQPASAQGDVWTSIGPPPEGGIYVSGLIVDPLTPSTLYAGSYYEGRIYKSIDKGATWSGVDLVLRGVFALAIDPMNPAVLYASDVHSLFKSTDGGASWSATALSSGYVDALAIDPQIPDTLYAGTWYFDGHVYKSTDGGSSWSALSLALTEGGVITLAIDPQISTTLYAGTTRGVFKSTDGGMSWNASGLSNGPIYALAVDPKAPATLYASYTDYSLWNLTGTIVRGLAKSIDGGAHWIPSDIGMPDNPDVSAIVLDPQAPATLYAGLSGEVRDCSASRCSGVFKSTNGGATWAAMNDGLTNLSVTALAIDSQTSNTLYAGTSGSGVFAITMTPSPAGNARR